MPLEETLAKVRREIESGDLGKARDRLHGLITTYPADLRLRSELGRVYWLLREHAMAGRYWYLDPETTPDMEQARGAFEVDRGDDARLMFNAIRFRCGLDRVDPSAHGKYRALAARAGVEVQEHSGLPGHKRHGAPRTSRIGPVVFQYGCMTLLATIAVLAIIGLLSIVRAILD